MTESFVIFPVSRALRITAHNHKWLFHLEYKRRCRKIVSGVIKGEKNWRKKRVIESGSVKTLKIMTRKRFVRMWPHAFCIRNGRRRRHYRRATAALSIRDTYQSTENDQTIKTYKIEKEKNKIKFDFPFRVWQRRRWRRWKERESKLAKPIEKIREKIMRE